MTAGREAAVAGTDAESQLRRLLLNGLSLLGAYVLPRACTFAAAVVAARVLGVATFGAYGSAAALAVILSIVANLGMMQLLVRDIARDPGRAAELIGAANVAKSVSLTIMLVALAAIGAGPLHYSSDVLAAALLLGAGYAVGAFAENLGGYFQAMERMGVWLEAQALYGLAFGGLGIVVLLATRDIVWFCATSVAAQGLALAWLLVRAPAPLRLSWSAPWPVVARLLRSLAPFAAAFVLLTAYHKVDIVLLEAWRGESEAGLYAAAYKFVDIAHALALVVAGALYPRLSRLAGNGGRHGGRRAAELLLLGAVPAAACLWLVRDPLISGLFGDDYAASASLVGILAPALPFLVLSALGTFVLAAAGRVWAVAALFLGGLALNVVLNALLIPGQGATGAALAMLGSEAVLGVGMLATVGRIAGAAPGARATLIALAAAAAAFVLGGVAQMGTGAAVAAYAILVVSLYSAVGVVTKAERSLLRASLIP